MSVEFKRGQEVLVASLGSRLDTNNSAEAETLVMEMIDAGELKIVMDLGATEYVSSAGLRVILKAAKILTQKGGRFALCQANDQVSEVLQISGFSSLIRCFATLEEAIDNATK